MFRPKAGSHRATDSRVLPIIRHLRSFKLTLLVQPTPKNDGDYVQIVTRGPIKRYDPEEMRRNKQSGPAGGELRWSESKPFEKRTTYRVVPKSQVPSFIANAQDNLDQNRTDATGASTNGTPYKSKQLR